MMILKSRSGVVEYPAYVHGQALRVSERGAVLVGWCK